MIHRDFDPTPNLWSRLTTAEGSSLCEKLDAAVPGEWDLTLEVLPQILLPSGFVLASGLDVTLKARLQILGVIREGVGTAATYADAADAAFAKAAEMFGCTMQTSTSKETPQ